MNSSKDSPCTVPTCPPATLGFSHSVKPPSGCSSTCHPEALVLEACSSLSRWAANSGEGSHSSPQDPWVCSEPSARGAPLLERSRSQHRGWVHKTKRVEAEAEFKWGSKKSTPLRGLPVAFTFPSETPCLPSRQHLRNRRSMKCWIFSLD